MVVKNLNNENNLSKETQKILLKNNKFKEYLTGDSDVHGQLEDLREYYSDFKLFKQMFEKEKEKNTEIHPLECTCITCPAWKRYLKIQKISRRDFES